MVFWPLRYIFSFFLFLFHLLFFFLFLSFFSSGVILSFSFFFLDVLNFDFIFVLDFISLGFSCFILLISSVVFLYSDFYMFGDLSYSRFIIVLFLFVISMIILVFGYNFFSLIVGWDGLGLVSFLLVIYYTNFSSLCSGLLTVLRNRFGDLGMLFSFYLIFIVGWWSSVNFILSDFFLLFFLLIFSAMTKRAQFPFSAWLPAAMAAPTPVSSLVHSSTLVTAGVYLLIRFYYVFSYFYSSLFFCVVSLFTIFSRGLLAVLDCDIKKIIAISTLSQLGFIMFAISLGEWMMSFFHIVCHALYKSLLFLSCGGFIVLSSGRQDIRFRGGVSFSSPFFFIVFVFSSISLFGFPFLSGFFSKDFILEFSFCGGWGFLFIILLYFSCTFSFLYSLRIFFFGLFSYMNVFCGFSFFFMSYVTFFLFILFFWSLFWGIVFGMIICLDNLFFVFSFMKSFGIFFIMLGSFFFFIYILVFKRVNSFSSFSDFFFLYWFSSSYFSSVLGRFFFFISSDLLWVEFFGPKYFINLNYISFYTLLMEKRFIKMSYLFFGLFILFIFFLSFWFFKQSFWLVINWKLIFSVFLLFLFIWKIKVLYILKKKFPHQ